MPTKTPLTNAEKATFDFYEAEAQNWASKHQKQDFWAPAFRAFAERLPAGSSVIEIGTGPGRDATTLINMGYKYLGTDISPALLKIATRTNPKTTFRTISLYDLTPNDLGEFDGFWCTATLLHVPRKKIDLAIKSIKSILKPGAIGFISLKKGTGELQIAAENPPRLFVYYQKSEFDKVLSRHGFRILWFDELQLTAKTTWLMYIIQKQP